MHKVHYLHSNHKTSAYNALLLQIFIFFSCNIPYSDAKIFKIQEEDMILPTSQKWKRSTTVPLGDLLNQHQYRLSLQNIEKLMIMEPQSNKKILLFQVLYIYFPITKHKKTFIEQVQKKMGTECSTETVNSIMKLL